MELTTECIGFQQYRIYLDGDLNQLAGVVVGGMFRPGPLADEMTSDELLALADFMEGELEHRLH